MITEKNIRDQKRKCKQLERYYRNPESRGQYR